MFEIRSDWSEIKREIRRLKRIPTMTQKRKLDRVLTFGLARAQAIVHIETGSLKSSGSKESYMIKGMYRGKFTFGGFSSGVNNPVDYAWYEQRRDANHDFMRENYLLHPMWVETIREILKG